jgi:hypothetical protein
MANFEQQRVPEVDGHNLGHIETLVVGQLVDVSVHTTGLDSRPIAESSDQLVAEATREVLKHLGLESDPSLTRVCDLVARVAIGKLVTGEGFEVKHGRFPDYYERVEVQLRPTEPTVRQAQVTRQPVGEI